MASKNRRKNRNLQNHGYESLEDRRVLVTYLGFDADTGTLDITLTSNNDSVVVDRGSTHVTVDGSRDLDTRTPGIQEVAYRDLRNINFINAYGGGLINQSITFNGNFSTNAEAALQNITVNGAKHVNFNGTYELAGDLNVTMVDKDKGGSLNDANVGWLVVHGETNVEAKNNEITIDNAASDFRGPVSLESNRDVTIWDADDLTFANIDIEGNFIAKASNTIGDVDGSNIDVTRNTWFESESVLLGENAQDDVNFWRVSSTTVGTTEINEDSNVILLNIDAKDLVVRTPAGIFDGRTTAISVQDSVTLEANDRIRIGDNGTDSFDAGTVNFNSAGHVHIWENSAMTVVGDNTAKNLDLFAEGNLTDASDAKVNVTGVTGFASGADIVLGETDTDEWNTGAIYFFAEGDFNYSENSDVHVIEEKNEARRMYLTSTGAITDSLDARINIERIADFTAESVNVGDGFFDQFNAGAVSFTTTGQFSVSENSDTNFVGFNDAGSLIAVSQGDITNVFTSANNEGTRMTVGTTASFTADNVDIGTQTNDTMNFGAVQLNVSGLTNLEEDSSTLFTGNSVVNILNLTSTGSIGDSTSSNFNATGDVALAGTSILLGDSIGDTFNAHSLNVQSEGAVDIDEDSSLNLHGSNTADTMSLVADGNITDSMEASTEVDGLFSVQGNLVNLGSEATDMLMFGSLNFSSLANTFITADSDIRITGTNLANNQLILTSSGDIVDDADADTRAANRAVLTGTDVIIGELASDCFDIINGGSSQVFVNASGTRNVDVSC